LMRMGRGILASIVVFVVGLVVFSAMNSAAYVAGYQVDASVVFGVAAVVSLVGLFAMALILLGLRDLSRVDGSFTVSYIGMIIFMLGGSVMALAAAATFLTGEAAPSIVVAASTTIVVGYVAAFIFSAVRLWMRYRHTLYMAAALLYAAPIATWLLFQYAPPIFAIIAKALMCTALKATARGVEMETQIAKDEK